MVETHEQRDARAKLAIDRAREFQRKAVIIMRRHGLGRNALTHAAPTSISWLTNGWWERDHLAEQHPEYLREHDALCAEYRDVLDEFPPHLRHHYTFAESELQS